MEKLTALVGAGWLLKFTARSSSGQRRWLVKPDSVGSNPIRAAKRVTEVKPKVDQRL